MKNKLLTLAGALALVAVLGRFYAKPLMAQVRAAMVQDVDQPARAPFQAVVPVNINNFNFTPVTIPSGKRLVIDYIAMNGATTSSGAYTQPVVILQTSVAGNPAASYYYAPQQSSIAAGEYYDREPATIYADTLSVGPAFSGYSPLFMSFNVIISGHLISLP